MCDVRPFCGLRYNLRRVRDPSSVISPPYDVISPEERTLFHGRSSYNAIRLELGEEQPEDSPESNKYTRAAATLDDWLRKGILVREKEPALYIVEHRFSYQDEERSRWALIGRVRLEDFDGGHIRPHEETRMEPAVDRFLLLKSCRTNTSPIMGLFRTEKGEMLSLFRKLGRKAPSMEVEYDRGVLCRLWVVTDRKATDGVSRFLGDRVVYIADGHHRYETALRYQKEQIATHPSHTGEEPFNFVMMALTDSCDPGTVVLPTHRLVRGVESRRIARLGQVAATHFELEEVGPPLSTAGDAAQDWLGTLEMRAQEGATIGVYGLCGGKFSVLSLRRNAGLQGLMTKKELSLWGSLDVVLLHRVILQGALGIETRDMEADRLEYTRDAVEAVSRVDSGEFQLAFFLNPVPVAGILDTADAGERLPRKSTYFYPKAPAGLVMNPVWDES